MNLKLMTGLGLGLAISAQAYSLIPINLASLQPWSYFNTLMSGVGPGPDIIIKYTTGFPSTQAADVEEAFREYSALFSAIQVPWERILFQFATPGSADVQFVVTSASNNIPGAGCTIINGKNSCTVYLGSNTKSARYWIGRALGIPSSNSSSDVFGQPGGTSAPFTVNDLNAINNTYSQLGLNPNGSSITKPMFLADYNNPAYGSEIVIGWDNLRARMVNNQNMNLSGAYRTIAAVPIVGGNFGPQFPLRVYQMGSSSAWYTWWPHQSTALDYTSSIPTAIKPTDDPTKAPRPGEGTTCSWTYSYSDITPTQNDPGLMLYDPSKGLATQLPPIPQVAVPPQYITPVYFYQAGLSYMASTYQPNSSCYRFGGYALAVE